MDKIKKGTHKSVFYIVTDKTISCGNLLRLNAWHYIPSEVSQDFHSMTVYIWQYHNGQDPMFHVEHWALQVRFKKESMRAKPTKHTYSISLSHNIVKFF